MDLFRYRSAPNAPLRNGELILPPDSVTWVERYRDPGEVKIESTVDTGIRDQLPVGTVVSHVETEELVRIEDHEITDDGEDNVSPKVIITGRSLEAPLLENRAAGSNIEWPTAEVPVDYIIPDWSTQIQAVSLVQRHVEAAYLLDDHDAVPYFEASTDIVGTLTTEERKIKAGSVYQRLIEILAVDDLGVRMKRPITGQTDTKLIIHKGVDRSASVIMSAERGDVKNVGYLLSERKKKNCALIVGRWVQTRIVDNSVSGWDRRWIVVDASDIDQAQQHVPTGGTRALIISAMQTRGREALRKNNMVEITKAEAAHDGQLAIFRKDYNVGDIVLVAGGYGAATKMRVSEYVEIQDDTGFTGYPTLEAIGEAP